MSGKIDLLRQAVDRISLEKPELKESLLFFSDILRTQEELSKRVADEIGWQREVIREKAGEVTREGKPLIEILGFPMIKQDLWKELMGKIIEIVKRHREELTEDLDKVSSAIDRGAFDVKELAISSLKGKDDYARGVAAGLDVELDLIKALALWTVQPILMSLKDISSDKINVKSWYKGYCPICGSYTRTGYMSGEGRKLTLKCEVCGMEWPFQRLKCPFCGNEDNKKLGFYSLDDNKFRLYVCDECGEYWKVVDEEIAGKMIPRELYPIWTFNLDDIASSLKSEEKEGSEEDSRKELSTDG